MAFLRHRSNTAYRVQNGGPTLHTDALKDGQHGEPDVVERRDAVVRALPLLQANRRLRVARVRAHWGVLLGAGKAGAAALAVVDHGI